MASLSFRFPIYNVVVSDGVRPGYAQFRQQAFAFISLVPLRKGPQVT